MNKQKKLALNIVEDWAEKIEKESNIMMRYLDRAYKKELQDDCSDVWEVRECIDSVADYASDLLDVVRILKSIH